MELAVFIALGLLIYVLICVWINTQLHYHLTPRHFKITLFGLRLRRIPLEQVASVSKRRPTGWAENWCNTLQPSHRMLVIRRAKGLRRFLVFTPKNRYVFKTDLERAMERIGSPIGKTSDDGESEPLTSEEDSLSKLSRTNS